MTKLFDTDTEYTSTDFIEVFTGRAFYPLEPKQEDLTVIDVAHALSLQCRYAGHTKFFYSTAQHSCLITDIAENEGASPDDLLKLLMHDAPEAYLVDVPRPVKQYMPEFRKWDKKINDVIYTWLGYPGGAIPAMQDSLDSRIIRNERRDLMFKSKHVWGVDTLEPLGLPTIRAWSSEKAERLFIQKFNKYWSMIHGKQAVWDVDELYYATEKPKVISSVEFWGKPLRVDTLGGCALVEITPGDLNWVHGIFEVHKGD